MISAENDVREHQSIRYSALRRYSRQNGKKIGQYMSNPSRQLMFL
jgi:hypothetical protein